MFRQCPFVYLVCASWNWGEAFRSEEGKAIGSYPLRAVQEKNVLDRGRSAWISLRSCSNVTSAPHLPQSVRGNADWRATRQLASGSFKGIFGWAFLVIQMHFLPHIKYNVYSLQRPSKLMFQGIIIVHCKNHATPVTTFFGQRTEYFLVLMQVVHIVIHEI